MKSKSISVILITILLIFTLTLSTISYASSNFVVNNVNVEVIDTKAEISWDKTSGASGYEVYVDLPYIGYQYIGNVEDNKVTIIGFTKNEYYSVKIRAYKYENNTKKYSDFSSEKRFKIGEATSETTKLDKVKNVKVVSSGTTGSLEWNSVKNASGYEIYSSLDENEFVFVGSTGESKIGIIGMNESKVYRMKIRAYIEENGRRNYGEFSDTAILKSKDNSDEDEKIGKVYNLKVSMDDDEAKLSWKNVKDADGYEIAVKIPNKGDVIYYSNNNSETLDGFSPNHTYKVRVRAYKYVNGKKVYGEYSSYENIRYNKKVEQVEDVEIDMDEDEATITWDRVKGADGYQVVVYKPGRGESKYNVDTTKKVLSGFNDPKKEYSVKVRAYEYINGKKYYGDYSRTKYFKCENDDDSKVDRVTGLNVVRVGLAATFRWNEVRGADGYEMVINIPGVGDCIYDAKNPNMYLNGFAETRFKYTVKVRAFEYIDGKKVYGEYSSMRTF